MKLTRGRNRSLVKEVKLTKEGKELLKKRENVLQEQLQKARMIKKDIAQSSGSRGDGANELIGIDGEIGRINTNLLEVRRNISQAVLIEDEKKMDTLKIGQKARVILSGEGMIIKVTDPVSADVEKGSISYNSPLGRVLLDSKPGDVRQYKAMDQVFVVKVLEINI